MMHDRKRPLFTALKNEFRERITTVESMGYPADKLIRRITSTQITAWDAWVRVKATPPGPQIKSNTAETR